MTAPTIWWPAPRATCPVDAVVTPPGSKSATNRFLILAALASGPSTLRGILRARDTELMIQGLTQLGCAFSPLAGSDTDVVVHPAPLRGPATIDTGLAGTVLRFLPAVVAGASGSVQFTGDPQAGVRPITPLLQALRQLGADIEGDHLPFTVKGHGPLPGGEVAVDASASSQFISALLLAGPTMHKGVVLHNTSGAPISAPHIDMTVDALRLFGARVRVEGGARWHVEPGALLGVEAHVEPDLTNAAVFLAAAAITQGRVTIPGWPATTSQPGDLFPTLLERMGARVTRKPGATAGEVCLSVQGPKVLQGLNLDLSAAGELVPTLAAVAACAASPTHLTGIGHVRGHETDRLAAIATELTRLGGRCEAGPDSLTIYPAQLHGADMHCYADHRMATFAALIGLRVGGIRLDDVGATSKTLPDFAAVWSGMVNG